MNNELTRQIIGAAIEVHKVLGPGLLESAYEACLCHELAVRGLQFEKKKPIPLLYKQIKLDCGFGLDLLVEGRVVVELQSIESLAPVHKSIMLTYLRLSQHELASAHQLQRFGFERRRPPVYHAARRGHGEESFCQTCQLKKLEC
jgi:GxxExxY protein